MALQQIYWEQIATEDIVSGTSVNLGNPTSSLDNIYVNSLYVSGLDIGGVIDSRLSALNDITGAIEVSGSDLTVKGNLEVLGSMTAIKSEVVTINDNIIELNGAEQSFGGLLIKDVTSPNLISGSLLWDTTNDRWIAGPLGEEQPITLIDDLVWTKNGPMGTTNHDLEVTGSVVIRGDLRVEGQTTMVSTDITQDSLIISGAMSILKNQITNQIRSASLSIENLGNLGDKLTNSVMDLGGF